MDGLLLFNKPILWTSHDAVDFVRRRIGQRRVGHAGTLDPLATGLLVILLGKATKRSADLSCLDKDYAGTMTLGITTDTQDLEGRIVSEADGEGVEREELTQVFSELQGAQKQTPPAFSAVRKNGKKLYDWVRRGVAVEAAEREIFISKFELIDFAPPEAHFFLTCSKGTYVRTLCDLIGRRLGCGASLSSLRRTRVGNFQLDRAMDDEALRTMSLPELEKRLTL